jgi:hypothetical protein
VVEEAQEIGILSVDVSLNSLFDTTDLEGSLQFEEDGLLHEDLLALVAEAFDFALEQVHLLGHLRVPHRQQLLDDVVHVDFNLALHPIYYLFELIDPIKEPHRIQNETLFRGMIIA